MIRREFDSGYFLGDLSLTEQNPVAIYSSREVPADMVLTAESFVKELARSGVVLAGGWHSPLERRLWRSALSGESSQVIYYLAKGIDTFRVPASYRERISSGRLLILSPFLNECRISRELVDRRDQWLLRHIGRVVFCFLDEQGSLVRFMEQCRKWNKEIFILEHDRNEHWISEGLIPIGMDTLYLLQDTPNPPAG